MSGTGGDHEHPRCFGPRSCLHAQSEEHTHRCVCTPILRLKKAIVSLESPCLRSQACLQAESRSQRPTGSEVQSPPTWSVAEFMGNSGCPCQVQWQCRHTPGFCASEGKKASINKNVYCLILHSLSLSLSWWFLCKKCENAVLTSRG